MKIPYVIIPTFLCLKLYQNQKLQKLKKKVTEIDSSKNHPWILNLSGESLI